MDTLSTTDDADRCVHCGMALDQHDHSSAYAVFWCPGPDRSQIYLLPWQVAAGHCVRCGQDRAHHRPAPDGRVLCVWFEGQTFEAATPGYVQTTQDMQDWDEAAEAMRQAMTTFFPEGD